MIGCMARISPFVTERALWLRLFPHLNLFPPSSHLKFFQTIDSQSFTNSHRYPVCLVAPIPSAVPSVS
jgi:hypothetical protein